MAEESNIKKELIKQMDKNSVEATDMRIHSARQIIEKHKAQLRRLKWSAAISWLITFLYFVAMHILKDVLLGGNLGNFLIEDELWLIRNLDTGLKVLIVISVFLSYLVYLKSRTLTILQVSARLANIEEYLKKMSQDK